MESLALSELNQIIKKSLEKNLDESYWVVAEISELKINQKGHCYVELVEKKEDLILAKIKATIWSYTFRNLSGWFESITGQSLKAGMKILCNVSITFHEVYGLSLNIRDIDPQYTLGERAIRRQEIINLLNKEGVFDMNRELDLPLVPQRIALIASTTSAGFQDFMKQIKYNPYQYTFDITIYNASVQGTEAETSIIEALLQIHKNFDNHDLVAIIRGGGAALDLECFDSYNLSSHVAQFPLPVITGIGHDKDETITDLVAHSKLKTPTAVAEFLITRVRQFEELIEGYFTKISDSVILTVQSQYHYVSQLGNELNFYTNSRLENLETKLFYKEQTLNYVSTTRMDVIREKIYNHIQAIKNNLSGIMKHELNRLQYLSNELELLNPVKILQRGYSITRLGGKPVKNLSDLDKDALIETEISKGKFRSKII